MLGIKHGNLNNISIDPFYQQNTNLYAPLILKKRKIEKGLLIRQSPSFAQSKNM
jgi:hypothetical protein